jgi:hypothetical protein
MERIKDRTKPEIFKALVKIFPFLEKMLVTENLQFLPVLYDENFLGQSLEEDESTALGHPNIHQELYLVRGDKLDEVGIRRTTTHIYPPQYLHPAPGPEFPDDVFGESEKIGEALARQDLNTAQFVVLHRYGDGRRKNNYRTFDEIVMARVEH